MKLEHQILASVLKLRWINFGRECNVVLRQRVLGWRGGLGAEPGWRGGLGGKPERSAGCG